jgi:hypothetical protein
MKRYFHHNLLFWPIGLLTLAGSSLMFFVQLANNPALSRKAAIEVNLTPPELWDWAKKYDPQFDIPPKGKWEQYTFSGDDLQNDVEFLRLAQRIKQFVAQEDTTSGLHIYLDRDAPYARFVHTLDLIIGEGIYRYSVRNSDVWIHRYKPHPHPTRAEPNIPIDNSSVILHSDYPTSGQMPIRFFKQLKQYWREEIVPLPFALLALWTIILLLNLYQLLVLKNMNSVRRLTSRSS